MLEGSAMVGPRLTSKLSLAAIALGALTGACGAS